MAKYKLDPHFGRGGVPRVGRQTEKDAGEALVVSRMVRIRLGWAMLAAAALSWVLCADDLSTARAALQDRLYPVAQAHAERVLLRAEGQPASEQALQVLLEALGGLERYDEILRRLDASSDVVRRAQDPEVFTYWRAWSLLNVGRPLEALRAAEASPAAKGAYADALRRVRARAKLCAGDLPGAFALYAEVDKGTTNGPTRAANALEWALALERSGRSGEALEVLKQQAELGVSCGEMDDGALLRGRLLMRQGKGDDATMVFNKLAMDERASERARVQALVEMSVYAMDGGKTNEAVAYARSACDLASLPETRRLAGFRLGDLLSGSAKTIDEGERRVKALVREFPDDPMSMRAQLKLADSLLQAQRPERAAAEYRIFLETYPASALDVEVLQGRGWALMKLGRYAEAGGIFKRASERATNAVVKVECGFKQGDALLAGSRFEEASEVYASLAEAFPKSAYASRALYQSAECLERAGKSKEAGARYRKVAETYPDGEVAARALMRQAALQAEAGDFEAAVRSYTAILAEVDRKGVHAEALMGRGKAYYRTYRFDAAMQDFAAVAETDPERRDEARFLLTLSLYGVGRDKEARAAGASFLLDFPASERLPDMMLWLGKLDFNAGKFEDARRFFLDYVTRWPTGRWADAALLWAARSASGNADFTGAVELVTRLVRAYPQSPRMSEALFVQGDALMELARFDEAVLLFDQIIAWSAAGEWGREALLRKADCLFALGAGNGVRYQEALEAYRALLAEATLPPAMVLQLQFKVGRCLEKLKKTDAAIDQYYAEVMVRYQEERARGTWYDETCASLFVRAAFNAAELYEQKGQPEQAVQVLQRVLQSGVPGGEEARPRIERLRKKRVGRT